MRRGLVFAVAALAGLPGLVLADGPAGGPTDGPMDGRAAGHAMDHAVHMAPPEPARAGGPTEPGQVAFAAIAEIVALLEADPRTDWAKVDVEALHRHLVDMDEVTMNAEPVMEPVPGGARFTVRGEGRTRAAIRRMVSAHAATMDGVDGWRFAAEESPEGAVLTATVADPAEVAKLRALGFIGVMTRGMHHQTHHMMIAAGGAPHE